MIALVGLGLYSCENPTENPIENLTTASNEVSSKEEIRKVMQDQENAWNEGDIPGFMEYYWKSDSLVFIGSNGIQNGWQSTLERYQRSYPDPAASYSTLQLHRGQWSPR